MNQVAEPSIQPPSQNGSSDKKRSRSKDWAPSVAIITTGVSIFAVVVSIWSIHEIHADSASALQDQRQQELTSIVEALAQIPAQQATLQETYKNNPRQLRSLATAISISQTIETQQAAELITELHRQVPATAAQEVGNSMVAQGLYTEAIAMYQLAATRAQGYAETIASSYRGWAEALYFLGKAGQAENKIRLAENAYGKGPNPAGRMQNEVFTSLFQIKFEVTLHHCDFVKQQFQQDNKLIGLLPRNAPYYVQDQNDAASEKGAVEGCKP